ncbi:hypothetical protein EGC77_17585 [Shewanella psychromarinicola]|uniref:Uncharacterized protein n=1 Tax=Shewanella psychromarinicola TaxID=2487742 RepID=A0A3N4DRW8_9GAMM|nr:hypothetical protein EGC77_17585 [Shewanella psychromarinicola]
MTPTMRAMNRDGNHLFCIFICWFLKKLITAKRVSIRSRLQLLKRILSIKDSRLKNHQPEWVRLN